MPIQFFPHAREVWHTAQKYISTLPELSEWTLKLTGTFPLAFTNHFIREFTLVRVNKQKKFAQHKDVSSL